MEKVMQPLLPIIAKQAHVPPSAHRLMLTMIAKKVSRKLSRKAVQGIVGLMNERLGRILPSSESGAVALVDEQTIHPDRSVAAGFRWDAIGMIKMTLKDRVALIDRLQAIATRSERTGWGAFGYRIHGHTIWVWPLSGRILFAESPEMLAAARKLLTPIVTAAQPGLTADINWIHVSPALNALVQRNNRIHQAPKTAKERAFKTLGNDFLAKLVDLATGIEHITFTIRVDQATGLATDLMIRPKRGSTFARWLNQTQAMQPNLLTHLPRKGWFASASGNNPAILSNLLKIALPPLRTAIHTVLPFTKPGPKKRNFKTVLQILDALEQLASNVTTASASVGTMDRKHGMSFFSWSNQTGNPRTTRRATIRLVSGVNTLVAAWIASKHHVKATQARKTSIMRVKSITISGHPALWSTINLAGLLHKRHVGAKAKKRKALVKKIMSMFWKPGQVTVFDKTRAVSCSGGRNPRRCATQLLRTKPSRLPAAAWGGAFVNRPGVRLRSVTLMSLSKLIRGLVDAAMAHRRALLKATATLDAEKAQILTKAMPSIKDVIKQWPAGSAMIMRTGMTGQAWHGTMTIPFDELISASYPLVALGIGWSTASKPATSSKPGLPRHMKRHRRRHHH